MIKIRIGMRSAVNFSTLEEPARRNLASELAEPTDSPK